MEGIVRSKHRKGESSPLVVETEFKVQEAKTIRILKTAYWRGKGYRESPRTFEEKIPVESSSEIFLARMCEITEVQTEPSDRIR